jgi:hypothetical protein
VHLQNVRQSWHSVLHMGSMARLTSSGPIPYPSRLGSHRPYSRKDKPSPGELPTIWQSKWLACNEPKADEGEDRTYAAVGPVSVQALVLGLG